MIDFIKKIEFSDHFSTLLCFSMAIIFPANRLNAWETEGHHHSKSTITDFTENLQVAEGLLGRGIF